MKIPNFIALPTDILQERLYGMEKMRRLPSGVSLFLSREDVRSLVLSLPRLLGEKREASEPVIEKQPVVTQQEMAEMVEMGRMSEFVSSAVKPARTSSIAIASLLSFGSFVRVSPFFTKVMECYNL